MFLVHLLTNAALSVYFLQRVFGLNLCFYQSARTVNDHQSYLKRILSSIDNFSLEWMFHFKCNSSCARPSRRFSYTEEHNASLVHNTIIEFVISAVYYYLLVQQSFPSLDLFPHGQIIFAVLWKKSAFRFILQMCHDCCDHMIGRGEGALRVARVYC